MMFRARTYTFLTLVVLMALIPTSTHASGAQHLPEESLSIVTKTGPVSLTVEIADTVGERHVGLMFRDTLAWDHGMLFDFDTVRPVTFWMKNTFIALDMMFIDQNGVITKIVQDVEPMSEELTSSSGPVKAVLELKAGAAKHYGIQAGNQVRHRIFGALN